MFRQLAFVGVHDHLAIEIEDAEVEHVTDDGHDDLALTRLGDAAGVGGRSHQFEIVTARDLLDAGHDALSPLDRCRIRQLHIEEQIAFILLGDEPRGRVVELPVSQHQETCVEQKHDRADAQHAAHNAAIDRDHAVEQAVEAPEEPAQDSVDRADDQQADRSAQKRTAGEIGSGDSARRPVGNHWSVVRAGKRRQTKPPRQVWRTVIHRQETADQTEDPPGQRLALELVTVSMLLGLEDQHRPRRGHRRARSSPR